MEVLGDARAVCVYINMGKCVPPPLRSVLGIKMLSVFCYLELQKNRPNNPWCCSRLLGRG